MIHLFLCKETYDFKHISELPGQESIEQNPVKEKKIKKKDHESLKYVFLFVTNKY